MSAYRKVVVARTLLLLLLVAVAAAFVIAIAADKDEGTLLDEDGVVTEEVVDAAPGD